MLQERKEAAIVLLGFRIGQLLEIYKDARVWPPAVAVLIPDLQANLGLAVRECGFEQGAATTIRGMVDQQLALFGDATHQIGWAGGEWFFDQLRKSCIGLETTIRSIVAERECTCLQVGVLLGKSFGEPPNFLEGRIPLPQKPSGDATWNYRSSDQLKSNLASLQLDIEQISGLPLDIPAFVAQLDPDDERFLRYPANHWGWVIIEERLITLRSDTPSDSRALTTHAASRGHSDSTPPIVGGEVANENRAIALAISDPSLSVAAIAKRIGVNRKSPYRWGKFIKIHMALQAQHAGSTPPRGSKDRDGNLEAEDDSE